MKTSIIDIYGKKMFALDTEIAKNSYRPGITNLTVKDDKGNDQFAMSIKLAADEGSIGSYGITCNGVTEDGNLAVLIKMGKDDTVETVKKAYGAKLVVAARYLDKLKNQMAAEATAVDAIFEGVEDGDEE